MRTLASCCRRLRPATSAPRGATRGSNRGSPRGSTQIASPITALRPSSLTMPGIRSTPRLTPYRGHHTYITRTQISALVLVHLALISNSIYSLTQFPNALICQALSR